MIVERLGCRGIVAMLRGGLAQLELNADIVDNLNVFPVPDGDTGVNMVGTIRSGIIEAVHREWQDLPQLLSFLIDQFTTDAKGNSGFLLATFLCAMLQAVRATQEVTVTSLSSGFRAGAAAMRRSVLLPKAGTILTSVEHAADAMARSDDATTILTTLERASAATRDVVFLTPSLLAVLRRNGVVDSGALGFHLFIDGALRGLARQEIVRYKESEYRFPPQSVVREEDELCESDVRYCVVLTISEITDRERLRELLTKVGESPVVLPQQHTVRVHVHTNSPREMIRYTEDLGRVLCSNVEDMHAQIEHRVARQDFAIIATVPGDGFGRRLVELGVEQCLVCRDDTPSVEALTAQIEQLTVPQVIALPHRVDLGETIRTAARGADRAIRVLDTKDFADCMSRMYMFNPGASFDDNLEKMQSNDMIVGWAVTHMSPVRHDELEWPEHPYRVFFAEGSLGENLSLVDAIERGLAHFDLSARSAVTVYTSNECAEGIVDKVGGVVCAWVSNVELEFLAGGQRTPLLYITAE